MDDTTVMIKVDFQDMQIIGMMHSVIVKNRAKCGVQEIRCQRLIVDIRPEVCIHQAYRTQGSSLGEQFW